MSWRWQRNRDEFEVEDKIDGDGELEFWFEHDYDSNSWWVPVEDVRRLHAHLGAVLHAHDNPPKPPNKWWAAECPTCEAPIGFGCKGMGDDEVHFTRAMVQS